MRPNDTDHAGGRRDRPFESARKFASRASDCSSATPGFGMSVATDPEGLPRSIRRGGGNGKQRFRGKSNGRPGRQGHRSSRDTPYGPAIVLRDPRRLPASAIRRVGHEHRLSHRPRSSPLAGESFQDSWLEPFQASPARAWPPSLTISPTSGEDSNEAIEAIVRGLGT